MWPEPEDSILYWPTGAGLARVRRSSRVEATRGGRSPGPPNRSERLCESLLLASTVVKTQGVGRSMMCYARRSRGPCFRSAAGGRARGAGRNIFPPRRS